MKEVTVWRYDAFTRIPGKGNPAGIIFEGDQYTSEEMQMLAKRIGYNECCFVCKSKTADVRLRYFTPGHETPLCGHATIAGVSAIMEQKKTGTNVTMTIETLAGLLTVGYDHDRHEVSMEQADAELIEFTGDKKELMQAIGLSESDYDERYPIVYGSTGSWTVIVPVRHLESFQKMQPKNNEFPKVLQQNNHASIHPMTLECYDESHTLHGRHFSSCFSGTIEDSVTGTASAVMGAYYLKYINQNQPVDFLVEQGNEINKEGTVHVFANYDGNCIKTKIAGQAVSNGTIIL